MMRRYAIDTGPLVALINRTEEHHGWVVQEVKRQRPPFLTCEAVITETLHLLEHTQGGSEQVMKFLERGFLVLAFDANSQLQPLARLMRRYADLPMSFADACLVRMTELDEECGVFTLDSDFLAYRKNSRQVIPVLMPPRS